MKKIFTFAAAVLASFSLWAADPNFESYDWQSQAEAEAVAGNHDGIVISYAGLGAPGNVSGHWYIPNNQNLKNSDNPWKYFGISANAQIDSVAFLYCPNGSNLTTIAWAAWGKDVTPNQYLLGHGVTAGTQSSKSWDNAIWETIDLSGIEAYTVYMSRNIREFREIGGSSNIPNFGGGQTINILGVRVWLHETKTIVSTVETLTAVSINDYPLAPADFTKLLSAHTLILEDSAYVTAPVVKFTKHTVITYDDQTTKETDEVIEKTSQQAQAGMWGAMADIAGVAYSVYTIKPLSYTVTYKNGTETLGTETVAANGNPAEYAKYETMSLATFGGWYKDAELTQAVANIAAEVITADATYYAKFTKAFLSKNVNIEQLVLDYGTKYDIKSTLTAAGWAYENLNDLDTLNDLENKPQRNEPYLGLKLKTAGAYIQGWLKVDGVLIVKFGNLGCNINVKLKGGYTDVDATFTKEDLWNADDQAYVLAIFGHAEDVLITISTAGSSTVVLKQLMLDELAPVTLPAPGAYAITLNAGENGTLAANWEGKTDKKVNVPVGALVTLTVTPAEGFLCNSLTWNGNVLHDDVEGQAITFVMPAEAVTVEAAFVAGFPTAIENTEATVKAVKVVRDGQLFIMKNGELYNMQGAVVK